ncbi:hypothetical protein BDB00DRAFT_822878 [Zychaea mexicana]|uniref:uncharacterized protein n=1 Tax=Zychaea mexicana TaxID=64656 RepID=UPI0022FE5104|nr:uncharacterized protein BDB00DRAFT_822878 [Zychaea mexicana]KAI9493611.1 hypothetical protein BDB00DRAFT_822878 [Zychaea mexicana]
MASFILENAGNIATTAIEFLEQKADDWKQVVPEAHDFQRECEHFRNIVHALTPEALSSSHHHGPSRTNNITFVNVIRVYRIAKTFRQRTGRQNGANEESQPFTNAASDTRSDYGSVSTTQHDTTATTTQEAVKRSIRSKPKTIREQGARAIVNEITKHIEGANKRLEKFIKEHERKKTWHHSVRWFFRRAIVAREYRDFFRDESTAVRDLLNDLVLCQKIAESAAIPKVDDFQKDMSEEPYLFWKKHMGQLVVANWQQFIDSYTLLYGSFDPKDLAYAERMLKSQGGSNQITVYGFISFTRKHGFPFKKSIATTTADAETTMSEEARMEITKMIMNMVTDFSEPAMQEHLLALYGWFKGLKHNNTAEIKKRADEWAVLIKASRDVEGEITDEQQKKAVNVDKARRAVSFFYQRYMVMWRVGQVSRETIKDVDFPGRSRIRDFLCYCGPLDRSNYHIVIGKTGDWEKNGKPKVYTFLEMLLKKNENAKREQYSNGAAAAGGSSSSRQRVQDVAVCALDISRGQNN